MQISKNWPSVDIHKDKVRQFILDNAAKGRIDGPYSSPPHKFFRASPLACLQKKSARQRYMLYMICHTLVILQSMNLYSNMTTHSHIQPLTMLLKVLKLLALTES